MSCINGLDGDSVRKAINGQPAEVLVQAAIKSALLEQEVRELKLQVEEYRKALEQIVKLHAESNCRDYSPGMARVAEAALTVKPKCECPHHSFKPDMQGCRCCGQSVGQGVEKRSEQSPKNDWCSNCGAVLATTEGRSFPSCGSCS